MGGNRRSSDRHRYSRNSYEYDGAVAAVPHLDVTPVRLTQGQSRPRYSQVTSVSAERNRVNRDEPTRWKVQGQAVAAGLGTPATLDLDAQSSAGSVGEEDFEEEYFLAQTQGKERRTSWRKKAEEEYYVDLTFVGTVKTGMELLDECQAVYLRAVNANDPAVAGKGGKKVFEILDHNGYRLYLMAGKKLRYNALLEFTWFDYRGQEILKTTGTFGGLWGGKMEIWLPSEDISKDLPIGIIVQKCGHRPKYRFQTEDKDTYTLEAMEGQWLCCSSGKHAPHNFDILDSEFEDYLGSIYKLEGYVNFENRELEYGEPIPNFDGCAIQFATGELGSQTKAMLICGAFLLSVQHFQKSRIVSWSCCSACCILVFALVMMTLCAVSLFSFFYKDEEEDKEVSNLRMVERADGKGSLIFRKFT